ncbi:MAG: hypothetical protein U5K84_09235 [Alkalibacterium sp.]|nr:hypothetical protein [Alkalibacterium sp.]
MAEKSVPFAAYFIVAWIIGYIHDRYKIDLADAEKEVDMLSNRYSLLNDLYMRSLEHKSLYEKQIISYKDSFGKLYKFTDRLEKAESDSYFNEALKAIEDILDNQTVSIYMASEKSQKAYRYVCSTKAEDIVFTQIDLKYAGQKNYD